MTVARSDDQKLLLLAGLEFSSDAELWVHPDGAWEVDRSTIYKFVKKHPYMDFSEAGHFDEVGGVFTRKLEKCGPGDFADNAPTKLLLNALRGLSYHLANRYGSRKKPFPKKGKTLRADVGEMVTKRFSAIEARVFRFAIKSVAARFTTPFGQRHFIAEDGILDGGVCFGITTHWCLRYLLRGKDSYASSKKTEEPAVIVDPKSKGVSERMAKKAPMIYHLQHRQTETKKLKEKESIQVADFLWDKVEKKGYESGRIRNLDQLYYDRAGYLPSNYYGTVQNYINMKSLGHSAASIRKLRVVVPGSGGFGASCYCLPPDGRVLRDAIREVFLEMSAISPAAYVVSYRLSRTEEDKDSFFTYSAPYFIPDDRGGHAMGVITDGKGSWTFMDPNFGEMNRKSKDAALELFTLLMAMYAIERNIREFVVMEVVKSNEGEIDPKRAFIFA